MNEHEHREQSNDQVTTDAFFSQRNGLIGLANRHAIPAIFDRREFVEAGGLLSYGGSVTDIYRLKSADIAAPCVALQPLSFLIASP